MAALWQCSLCSTPLYSTLLHSTLLFVNSADEMRRSQPRFVRVNRKKEEKLSWYFEDDKSDFSFIK